MTLFTGVRLLIFIWLMPKTLATIILLSSCFLFNGGASTIHFFIYIHIYFYNYYFSLQGYTSKVSNINRKYSLKKNICRRNILVQRILVQWLTKWWVSWFCSLCSQSILQKNIVFLIKNVLYFCMYYASTRELCIYSIKETQKRVHELRVHWGKSKQKHAHMKMKQ